MAILATLVLCNLSKAETLYSTFIGWIRVNPYLAILAIIAYYTLSVSMCFPIVMSHLAVGFTYAQVFESQWKGLLFAFPVVFTGCLSGAMAALLLSRYLFRSIVHKQIAKSQWLNRNFNATDDLLQKQGALATALLRLTLSPFGITSHILGVTSIAPLDYLLGTCAYSVVLVM